MKNFIAHCAIKYFCGRLLHIYLEHKHSFEDIESALFESQGYCWDMKCVNLN